MGAEKEGSYHQWEACRQRTTTLLSWALDLSWLGRQVVTPSRSLQAALFSLCTRLSRRGHTL